MRTPTTRPRQALGWAALGLLAATVAVPAANGEISDIVFAIQASNDSGSGQYAATFDEGIYDPVTQTFTWSLAGPVELLSDSGRLIATLEDAALFIHDGSTAPEVQLDFDVVAGSSNTEFLIDSALVSFRTIPADLAAGRFGVSATVWDLSNPSNGVWMVKLGSQAGIFQSYYNGPAPDGAVFRELLGVIGSDSSGSATGGEVFPQTGHAPMNSDVGSISVGAAFVLTAEDRADGTATFEVVPEPGVLALLTFGMLLAARRGRA